MNTSNQPAFPVPIHKTRFDTCPEDFRDTGCLGMTKREWMAAHAPPAPEWWLDLHRKRDRSLNPHNDSYKPPIRGETELLAAWSVEWADVLLTALSKS